MNSADERLGSYDVGERIGAGAFAEVYRAVERATGRVVALKILKPELAADERFVRMFIAEASTIRELRHEHIVSLIESGMINGRLCIVMSYASRGSLKDLLLSRGPLPWSEMLTMIEPIAAALDYAHHRGVLHRDLTPANILIGDAGEPLLSDFGLADMVGKSVASRSLRRDLTGTFQYLAPEVWKGEPHSPRSDIYSFACIIYELLIGAPLFQGEHMAQIFAAHQTGPRFPRQWPEGVPARLTTVLRAALAPEPATRPASAMALVSQLRALGRRSGNAPAHNSRPSWLVPGLIALLILGAGGLSWYRLANTSVDAPPSVTAIAAGLSLPTSTLTASAAPTPNPTTTFSRLSADQTSTASRSPVAISTRAYPQRLAYSLQECAV